MWAMSSPPAGQDAAGPTSPADRRPVLRQAISVAVASGTYGISFGALSVASGLDLVQTMALSLLMFTGGSQFAFVGVLAAGGAGGTAAATAGLLGLRNGFYGLQMAPLLATRGWRRPVAAQLTIDESTAVGVAQSRLDLTRFGFWATGLSVFVLWNCATLAGAVIGDALGDPRRYGLDAAAAAAFLALVWPRLRPRLSKLVAAGAAVLATVLIPRAPAGVPVLAAVLVALAAHPLDRP